MHGDSKDGNLFLTKGSLARRGLSERALLQSDDLPSFALFPDADPAVPDDGPLKKGNKNAGENSHGLHFSLDQQEIFERAHGNPNWPNQNNGNGNGPSGNGKGNGNGYGLGQPEQPAGVACTATDNCVTPSNNVPITYHGGPGMYATTKLPKISSYVIFYGGATDWQDATSVNIVTDFFKSIGNSDYFQINQGNLGTDPANPVGYYSKDKVPSGAYPPNGAGNPGFGGYVFDRSWTGRKLSQASLQAIVQNALYKSVHGIASTPDATQQYPPQGLPIDASGIYFVITAPALTSSISGFCTQFCGYHSSYTTSVVNSASVSVKWSFVGDPAKCMTSCSSYNRQQSPNGRPSIDAMMSVVAHELVETVTDPNGASGWFDSSGMENADKCAWTYGRLSSGTSSTGATYYYNTVLGSRQYLIQMNYVNKPSGTGYCAMTFDYPHQTPVY